MLCPKCKSDHAHRSHRRGAFEHLASLFAYNPYRCRECDYRFFRFPHADLEPAPAANAAEREVMSTRAKRVRGRKRRELLLYGGAALLFGLLLWFIARERDSSSEQN